MRISARQLRLAAVASLIAVLSSCGHAATKLAIDDRSTPVRTCNGDSSNRDIGASDPRQSVHCGEPAPMTTSTTVDKAAVARWNVAVWNNAVWVNAVKHAEAVRAQTAKRMSRPSEPRAVSANIASAGSVNGYPCGGDLPPCCTLQRESGGNPTIVEGNGSGYSHASGLWQFMPGTWNNYDGYPYAAAAPASVQNAKAAAVWNHGAGYRNWVGDGCL